MYTAGIIRTIVDISARDQGIPESIQLYRNILANGHWDCDVLDCNDGDICTDDECDGAGLCLHIVDPSNAPSCAGATTTSTTVTTTSSTTSTTLDTFPCSAAPAQGCFTAGRMTFLVKDKVPDSKDQIKWKWIRGEETGQGDMGNPLATTIYGLCIYDGVGGAPVLVGDPILFAPDSAWQDKNPKGWKYKDKLGSNDGVQKAQLKPGAALKSKAQVKAKGVSIPMPAPAQSEKFFEANPSVIVQLVTSEGKCWTSEFSTAKKNSGDQYKAKGP